MFGRLILELRGAGVPASLTEYLTLLGAVRAGVVERSPDDFYLLARSTLVKDERHLDRFDRVFGEVFRGVEKLGDPDLDALPDEWLRQLAEKLLTPEEREQIEALGGFKKLMETLRERLAEQKKRHQGGNKWIGTGGTSPFGSGGTNPEGVRIGGGGEGKEGRAAKVWEQRAFRDLDGDRELGTRNLKLALRRLRRFAREGTATELDLPGTVRATAGNAGTLDLRLVAERRNAAKVLLLLDIGGSMDEHVERCAELFSAARSEFKYLESFYFHNCPYERLWRTNKRRPETTEDTAAVLRRFGPDWKLILVGDASMSPYELVEAGGSVEHWNDEPGRVWLDRLTGHFRSVAWLNPTAERFWGRTQSVGMVQKLMGGRMFPLTLVGLDEMARELGH